MNRDYEYVFPTIRGVQSGREYYASMCPLHLIPRMFVFDDRGLPAELRAQRSLNKGRVPEMKRYMIENRDNYVFSAITASIDGDATFEPMPSSDPDARHGVLHVPMEAKFIINDGQHRREAIAQAIEECPDLKSESIAVVFFIDQGLKRCQQMFADLNRYAIRPSTSLGVLYDHRDEGARLTKLIAFRCPVFQDVVETEKSSLSRRSHHLFTLSALHTATVALFAGRDGESIDDLAARADAYWSVVDRQILQWRDVRAEKVSAGDVRRDFIHSYGIGLHAMGRLGNALLRDEAWKKKIAGLRQVDWRRARNDVWEGRAMIGGRVSKALHNVTLTTNLLKQACGVVLSAEEERVEDAFARGRRGNTN